MMTHLLNYPPNILPSQLYEAHSFKRSLGKESEFLLNDIEHLNFNNVQGDSIKELDYNLHATSMDIVSTNQPKLQEGIFSHQFFDEKILELTKILNI